MGIFYDVIHCIDTHFDKCLGFVILMLNTILCKSIPSNSETLLVMKKITQCTTCMSNEILCMFHSKMVKTSVVNDVQKWLKYSEE